MEARIQILGGGRWTRYILRETEASIAASIHDRTGACIYLKGGCTGMRQIKSVLNRYVNRAFARDLHVTCTSSSRQDRDLKEFRGFPGMELGIFRVAKSSGEGRVFGLRVESSRTSD